MVVQLPDLVGQQRLEREHLLNLFSREEANPPVFEQLRRLVCVPAFHGRG